MPAPLLRRVLAALCLLLPGTALAQAPFPNRPIQMLVGFPAGGGADLIARALQNAFQAELGQPVVIRNVTGAGGTIATGQVAQAAPDGHTVLFAPGGGGTVYLSHTMNLPFARDAIRPACAVYDGPGTLMVAPDSPFRTPQDVIAAARARPGSILYASPAAGSAAHVSMAALARALGLQMELVVYRGSADIALAMRAGQVHLFADAYNIAQQLDLRPIGLFRREPLPMQPELPLMREVGATFDFSIHGGIHLPRGTPEAIVQRWEAACRAVMALPDSVAALQRMRVLPNFMPGAEYAAFLEREHQTVGEIIRAIGVERAN